MVRVETVRVESDEHGFELHLLLDEDVCTYSSEGALILNVQAVAEELYDAVKASIGPWLQEMEDARSYYHAAGTGRLTDAEREEEIRCAAHGMEGPNAKQWRYEQSQ